MSLLIGNTSNYVDGSIFDAFKITFHVEAGKYLKFSTQNIGPRDLDTGLDALIYQPVNATR